VPPAPARIIFSLTHTRRRPQSRQSSPPPRAVIFSGAGGACARMRCRRRRPVWAVLRARTNRSNAPVPREGMRTPPRPTLCATPAAVAASIRSAQVRFAVHASVFGADSREQSGADCRHESEPRSYLCVCVARRRAPYTHRPLAGSCGLGRCRASARADRPADLPDRAGTSRAVRRANG
jgi:hypothetical protein